MYKLIFLRYVRVFATANDMDLFQILLFIVNIPPCLDTLIYTKNNFMKMMHDDGIKNEFCVMSAHNRSVIMFAPVYSLVMLCTVKSCSHVPILLPICYQVQ